MDRRIEALLEKVAGTPEFQHVRFNGIGTVNALGDNALHVAVRWGDLEGVQILVEGGIDVNKAAKYLLWRFNQVNRAHLNLYPQ